VLLPGSNVSAFEGTQKENKVLRTIPFWPRQVGLRPAAARATPASKRPGPGVTARLNASSKVDVGDIVVGAELCDDVDWEMSDETLEVLAYGQLACLFGAL
jgi:hypothetical protein